MTCVLAVLLHSLEVLLQPVMDAIQPLLDQASREFSDLVEFIFKFALQVAAKVPLHVAGQLSHFGLLLRYLVLELGEAGVVLKRA